MQELGHVLRNKPGRKARYEPPKPSVYNIVCFTRVGTVCIAVRLDEP